MPTAMHPVSRQGRITPPLWKRHRTILAAALISAVTFVQATTSLHAAEPLPDTRLALDRLQAEFPHEDAIVFEPHDGSIVEYRGLPLIRALDRVLGEHWRTAEAIEFVCADGYRASIEVSDLLGHRAWLAYARSDGQAFEVNNQQQGERVPLGPFYLVWDSLTDEAVRARGASIWPYQIISVAPVALSAHFARAMPPAHAPTEAHRGFEVARQFCLHCHTMNGDGGHKGPELNTETLAARYADDAWLSAQLLAPERLRPGTTMPALDTAAGKLSENLNAVKQWLAVMTQPAR